MVTFHYSENTIVDIKNSYPGNE